MFEVTVAHGNFWELNMTSSHAHRPYLYLISFLYGFYPRLAGSTAANKKAASILDLLFYIISVVLYTRSYISSIYTCRGSKRRATAGWQSAPA